MIITRKTEELVLNICKYLIYSTPFIAILILKSTFFVFIFGKVIIFRIIIEVLFFLYILLIIINKKYKPTFNLLTILPGVYILYLLIRSFFAPNFDFAFWGNFERMDGIFSLIHYYIFFIIICSLFRKQKDWVSLFKSSVFAGILICFYGFLQYFNIDLNGFIENAGIKRISSTLGNAGFFSGYLIFQIFILFFLINVSENKKWKIFYYITGFLNILCLIFAQTRGALLGFAIGLIVFYILNLFNRKFLKKYKIYIGLIILFLGLGYSFLWFNRNSEFVSSNSLLSRYTDISFETGTAKTRFWTWNSAWNAWRENIFFGWGYNNFGPAFNKYFNSNHFQGFGGEVWFDKAHNIIFDVGTSSGFIGIFLYLSIFLAIFYFCLKEFKKDHANRWLYSGFFVVFLIYLIQNLFIFDTIVVYIYFYMILGFLVYFNVDYKEQESKKFIDSIYLYILIILMILCVYLFNIVPFKTNSNLVYAIRLTQDIEKIGNKDLVFKYYEKINNNLTINPLGKREYLLRVSSALIDGVTFNKISKQDFETGFDLIEPVYRDFESKSYGDVQFSWILGRFYNAKYQISNDFNYLEKAENVLKRSYNYAPGRFETVFELAQNYAYRKDYEKAEKIFLKAVEYYPELPSLYWYLGSVYIFSNKLDLADQNIQKAINMGFDFSQNFSDSMQYVNLYSQLNQLDRVKDGYLGALKTEPKNYQILGALSVVYYELGDINNAIEFANKSLEYGTQDPDFNIEMRNFIEKIK